LPVCEAFGRFLHVTQTTASGAGTVERRFRGPLRVWEIVFLAALSLGILIGAAMESRKEYFGNDELITSILVSNPSFSEMWSAIRRGGELNPPLYFILEWVMARMFGTGELALRAISGISIALAGWVLYFTVRPLSGPRVAALSIALVLGLSRDVFYFAREARYYGVLFLLVSLGVFLLLRLTADRPVIRRDYLLIFLVHCAMVYLHLYGLIYSGVLFVAMAAMDLLRGKLRWGLLGAVLAAWVSFCAWLPATLQQFKSVSQGVYTPPGFLKLGFFVEELALQTPLALVVLFISLLGCFALISSRPCRAAEEIAGCSAPVGWAALGVVALMIMSVPVSTWLASHFLQPPPYMHRYMFPCTAAWVLVLALMMVAVFRLPALNSPFEFRVSPRLWDLAWIGVLIFCVGFQPMRARKNPARATVPFVDDDFGYKDLPMVFENSWYFVQRAHYGQGREYVLLIDREAAEADPGWYTKATQRLFQGWHPHYHKANIAYYDELPGSFLAVDDDYTKTFEWVFAHHPGLTRQLLGTHKATHDLHGEERIYLVQKKSAAKRE
jgi:hypothetical protein